MMPNGENSSTGSVISNDDDEIVEITLDVREDNVAVHSIKTVCGADVDDQKKSSLNASSKFSRISQELKRLTSFSKKLQLGKFDRTTSAAAHGLKGLRFISKTGRGAGWPAVEERFDDLTSNTNGMNKDSKEFSLELFDALGRRRYFSGGLIDKSQLNEYWDQISDHNFDSRLQTFFDMIDQDKDGRITEEDVKKIINLSASANKLYTIQKEANEYAPLIMEEFDPDNLGYIMIENLKTLLLQAPTHAVSQMISQMLDYPF